MSIENLRTVWQEIAIDIEYNPNTFNAFKETYGYGMGHFKIKSADKTPLPITATGFKSRFVPDSIVQDFGGAVNYVQAWLDDAAQAKHWKIYLKTSKQPKQLRLF